MKSIDRHTYLNCFSDYGHSESSSTLTKEFNKRACEHPDYEN